VNRSSICVFGIRYGSYGSYGSHRSHRSHWSRGSGGRTRSLDPPSTSAGGQDDVSSQANSLKLYRAPELSQSSRRLMIWPSGYQILKSWSSGSAEFIVEMWVEQRPGNSWNKNMFQHTRLFSRNTCTSEPHTQHRVSLPSPSPWPAYKKVAVAGLSSRASRSAIRSGFLV